MKKNPIDWVRAVWRFVVDVALRWYHGRVGDLAASVTFWILISLPALVLALLAVLGPIDRLVDLGFSQRIRTEVEEFIARVFTDEGDAVSRTVIELFDDNNNSLAIVSFSLAIWSISRGFSGLIRALEDIYDIEDRRPWYHTRVVAVILGFGSILISVPIVLMEIYVWAEIDDGWVESTLRGLVAITVLILWASIVYHYGPAERHRWRFDLPGAVVAALLWWLLVFGFARYVDIASGANAVRSVFGAIILALTWIWLVAQVLLIGGAVNYLLGQRLGVRRGRRSWTINEVVTKSTGEIRKIVVPDRDDPTLPMPATAQPGGPTSPAAPSPVAAQADAQPAGESPDAEAVDEQPTSEQPLGPADAAHRPVEPDPPDQQVTASNGGPTPSLDRRPAETTVERERAAGG